MRRNFDEVPLELRRTALDRHVERTRLAQADLERAGRRTERSHRSAGSAPRRPRPALRVWRRLLPWLAASNLERAIHPLSLRTVREGDAEGDRQSAAHQRHKYEESVNGHGLNSSQGNSGGARFRIGSG